MCNTEVTKILYIVLNVKKKKVLYIFWVYHLIILILIRHIML
uniref:Uncharacterized protein n=1 Tax=Anguilla anguilla TaxID=7936 RepID=A0A0E9RFE7_ANGAN